VELLAQAQAEAAEAVAGVAPQAGVAERWTPPRLDSGGLLRRAQGLTQSAAPAVPALCLRLTGYARSLHPDVDDRLVRDWALHCFGDWLERLGGGDPSTVEATLETDPANLVLGAKALPDPALSARCIRAQLDLYDRTGVDLPRLNQTVLGALLEPDDPQPAARLTAESLDASDLLADPSPAALAALGLLSRRAPDGAPTAVPPALVAALTLRSVWMGDLSGVGLTLLGASLLGIAVPPGLLPWIARVAREDGLFGMWELYADPHPVANLLGTVNLYWGLSVAAGVPARGRAGFPEPAAPSRTEVEHAIGDAQQWLDRVGDRFSLLPACRDDDHFESTFKPLVEMVLLCHILTRPRHDGSPWARWARSTAERLHPHVEWEGLIEAFRLRTSATLGIGIYALLQSATNRRCRFTAEARRLLADPFAVAQERTPMREMDYQFTRALMGLPPTLELRAQLSRSLLRTPFDLLLMDTDALYDLTHIAFYATQFGCVPWAPPPEVRAAWPAGTLGQMTLARLLMGDADLGAELLLTELYTGEAAGPLRARCLRVLVDAQCADGSFPGPEPEDDTSDEFASGYHTTLVAMAALAESLVSRAS
jgi:hypothetical protein